MAAQTSEDKRKNSKKSGMDASHSSGHNEMRMSTDELAELISNDGKSCNIDELVAKIIQSATPTDRYDDSAATLSKPSTRAKEKSKLKKPTELSVVKGTEELVDSKIIVDTDLLNELDTKLDDIKRISILSSNSSTQR